MKITLSKSQQEVVDYSDGNLLVTAGAGSGKTRVLTQRIAEKIKNLKSGQKVLAITFSNKAAEELKTRLSDSIGVDKLIESVYVGTIHNFCLDVVTSKGHLINLPYNIHIFESYEDRMKIFVEAIKSVPELNDKISKLDVKEQKNKLSNFFESLSIAKRNLKFSENYGNETNVRMLFEEYDRLLLSQGAIDFDDILRYCYKLFNERESVLALYNNIYKYIFVDEAQDLNRAQYEIIKVMANNKIEITMVGDPNQAIYGFNGSSNKYMTSEYVEDFKPKKIILNENFRSSKTVIEAAKKIEPTFEIDGVCPYDGEFKIHKFSSEIEEAEWIINKINELLLSGHKDIEGVNVELEQISVLARNRYVFNVLEQKLKDNNIAYNLKTKLSNSFGCESDLVNNFILGLKLIVNEKDVLHLKELLNSLNIKKEISFKELVNKESIDEVNYWSILKGAWNILIKDDQKFVVMNAIKSMRDNITSQNQNISDEEKILICGDLDVLDSLIKVYISNSNLEERNNSHFIRSVAIGLTQLKNEEGLTLSTVHMSKGLEYDVVFVMGMNQGVFPDYRTVGNKEKEAEEKHNIFVAITRSKRLCFLTYPEIKNMPWGARKQQPSEYIKLICQ